MSSSLVSSSAHEVAEAIARAISERNVTHLDRVYSENVVVWHNFTNKSQTRAESLAMLADLLRLFNYVYYSNIRRELTPSGYVQQHVVIGEMNGGQRIEVPFCQVCVVQDGKLLRMDEYCDPAQLTAVLSRLRPLT